ncbi:SDR family NAD(P)-dependent oxidoreductase [Egicoccus halophilus]|uniref:Short-chain dehydrogenase n=1 Tax=Egicoccus halophilus TaxID=1670830 RepID=A0A8J3EVQ8_9ACTN|nr:SDR family oxidoreductase [Egicoccus halophilus]GGI08643.1 short-chain dehydrogenase [Egicoccus halophilus]
MKLAGKVVVVVGGGNGIGREVVLELLRRGARVAAVDLRKDALEDTVERAGAGDRLATFALDISDREAVGLLPQQVLDTFSQVDGLLNVAGIIQPFVRLAELDDAAIDRVVDVNLYGTLYLVKAFLPHLLARPVAHIGNVSSMGGFLPVPGQTVYGASKAAVKLLTEGLYAELIGTPVAVSVILPGAVRTEITTNSGVERPGAAGAEGKASRLPMTMADAAARIILDGIEEDRLHIFVGKDSRVMNLLTRLAPKRATHLIQRQMQGLLG